TPKTGKTILIVFCATLAALFLATLALSTAALAEKKEGSDKQGKFLFRSKCKECHWPEEEGGEVTPMTYTQAQWKSFFERNKHKRKKDVWTEMFTPAELVDIKTYLINHASDSEQPETCG
ncbi:MAG: hypothetical protein ACWGSD_14855, partial [Thermodesulfobacteriota bacterium]